MIEVYSHRKWSRRPRDKTAFIQTIGGHRFHVPLRNQCCYCLTIAITAKKPWWSTYFLRVNRMKRSSIWDER